MIKWWLGRRRKVVTYSTIPYCVALSYIRIDKISHNNWNWEWWMIVATYYRYSHGATCGIKDKRIVIKNSSMTHLSFWFSVSSTIRLKYCHWIWGEWWGHWPMILKRVILIILLIGCTWDKIPLLECMVAHRILTYYLDLCQIEFPSWNLWDKWYGFRKKWLRKGRRGYSFPIVLHVQMFISG